MTLPWAAAIGPALLILFSAGEPGRVVKGEKVLYTFAFLGRYHDVLDGPNFS